MMTFLLFLFLQYYTLFLSFLSVIVMKRWFDFFVLYYSFVKIFFIENDARILTLLVV